MQCLLVIGIRLYKVDSIFKMIVERFALGTAKNLNLSEDFAFGEGVNGTFKTAGRKEKPFSH
jgi:hypothetical protein